jgi:hypothetical protein
LSILDQLIPLKSSHTDAGNGGAPAKSDGEISDAGVTTRDDGSNEGKDKA